MLAMNSKQRVMSIRELTDELTYANYAHNRRICPGVTVERWAKVYGPSAYDMENRFQREEIWV